MSRSQCSGVMPWLKLFMGHKVIQGNFMTYVESSGPLLLVSPSGLPQLMGNLDVHFPSTKTGNLPKIIKIFSHRKFTSNTGKNLKVTDMLQLLYCWPLAT